jgi:hypothetical protein
MQMNITKNLVVRRFAALLVAAGLGLALVPASSAQAPANNYGRTIPANCPKECLNGVIDKFLAAMIAHNPKAAQLSDNVRYTEMGQQVPVGLGLWTTITGLGNYKHYMSDPEVGQAAYIGTVQEDGNIMMLAVRLGIRLGKVTEAELVYYRRGGGPAFNDAGIDKMEQAGMPDAAWLEVIPASERITRPEMIEVANKYFDHIQGDDGGKIFPFTDDCDRIENGAQTTNNPTMSLGGGGFNNAALSCKGQFEIGYFYAIAATTGDRRFVFADPETGVVFCFVAFHNKGVKSVTLTDGRVVQMGRFSRPSTLLLAEVFKVQHRAIRRIWVVGNGVPYRTPTGWPGGVTGR